MVSISSVCHIYSQNRFIYEKNMVRNLKGISGSCPEMPAVVVAQEHI